MDGYLGNAKDWRDQSGYRPRPSQRRGKQWLMSRYLQPSRAEPQCSRGEAESSSSSPSSPSTSNCSSTTHPTRLSPTTTGAVARLVNVPSITLPLPKLTPNSLGTHDQAEHMRCQASDQADQARCQAGRGDHLRSPGDCEARERCQARAEQQRRVQAEPERCQADQRQEDDLQRCQVQVQEEDLPTSNPSTISSLSSPPTSQSSSLVLYSSPNSCNRKTVSNESQLIVCKYDQLTLDSVTPTIDLVCAKPPKRLPANFGVGNANRNVITEPQQARDCAVQQLKPREPSDRAGPPTRREMRGRERRFSAQPMGGS